MTSNRKVICAGCGDCFLTTKTEFYRSKRWCGNSLCKENIDYKVKNANYKKAQKKIENGTFRHGVNAELRETIKQRDEFTCRLCLNKLDSFNLQVHHIVPVSNGGNDDLNNLVLLCNGCHTKLHKEGWELYVSKLEKYTSSLCTKI
jgi:5-methylcytosine-specific restriction endonuclease McrA